MIDLPWWWLFVVAAALITIPLLLANKARIGSVPAVVLVGWLGAYLTVISGLLLVTFSVTHRHSLWLHLHGIHLHLSGIHIHAGWAAASIHLGSALGDVPMVILLSIGLVASGLLILATLRDLVTRLTYLSLRHRGQRWRQDLPRRLVRRESIEVWVVPGVLLAASGSLRFLSLSRPLARRDFIIISTQLVHLLDDTEITAILAHEISHLRARETGYQAWLGGLVRLFSWDPLLAGALRRQHHARECRADRGARRLGADPRALRSALAKLSVGSRDPRSIDRQIRSSRWRPLGPSET